MEHVQKMMVPALFLTTLLELRFETLLCQPLGFLNLIWRHALGHMVPVFYDFRF